MTKICSRCGESRPLADYYADPKHADGLQSSCKSCQRERLRTWRKNKPDHARSLDQKRHHRDRDKRLVAMRDSTLRRKYGLSAADYQRMLEEQGGVCAGCHRPNVNGKPLFVDHCHTTGRVRALLCLKCNTVLGLADESPDRLRVLAHYIEFHQSSQRRKTD